MNLSVASLKILAKSPEFAKYMVAYLKAKKVAEKVRVEIDKIYGVIFANFIFIDYKQKMINHPKNLYIVRDGQEEKLSEFYALCNEAVKHYGLEDGKCPALVAENKVSKAEQSMLEYVGGFFEVPFHESYGPNREKAVKLFTDLFMDLSRR